MKKQRANILDSPFLDNAKLVGLKFKSEKIFNAAVDALFKKYEYEVVGFNVLLVPKKNVRKIQAFLIKKSLRFKEVRVTSTSELTEAERKILYNRR